MVPDMTDKQSHARSFAAEAVARLYSGELTESEERNIESWLEADPCHRAEFQKMLDAWDIAGAAGESGGSTEEKRTRGSWVGRRFPFGIAASLLVLAGVSLLMFVLHGPDTALTRYQTGIGEMREVELVDGSRVTLNTDTGILVEFSKTSRRIVLDRGEAFFDIEKDVSRPLTVLAGDRVITVLGTSFNVSWDGRDVTVAVIEGRVAVQAEGADQPAAANLLRLDDASGASLDSGEPGGGVVLLAGEVAQISRRTEPVIEAVSRNTDRYQSWRFGYIRFDDEPLRVVVKEINRYTSKPLDIQDARIANMKVSGLFHTAEIDNTISGLELIFPVKIVDRGDRFLIVAAD